MPPVSSIDLHLHTYYSDGKPSPAEVLACAARTGVKTLAITDHDNTRGVREAMPLAPEYGVDLVPGIEFTCGWPGCDLPPGDRDIDLLGYFIDPFDPQFAAFERATLEDIHARMADCCAILTAAGYPVSSADLAAENSRYTGLQQMFQVVLHKGYARTWKNASQIVFHAWEQVRFSAFPIQEVIAQIHRCGGVAVLAHPITVHCNTGYINPENLEQLVDWGLDGIEVYHRRLDDRARAYFKALARDFRLLVTGGSDAHGWYVELEEAIGTQPVHPQMVTALRARHKEYCR